MTLTIINKNEVRILRKRKKCFFLNRAEKERTVSEYERRRKKREYRARVKRKRRGKMKKMESMWVKRTLFR